jgi:hypothetical protein
MYLYQDRIRVAAYDFAARQSAKYQDFARDERSARN